jgi:hypothetical protein
MEDIGMTADALSNALKFRHSVGADIRGRLLQQPVNVAAMSRREMYDYITYAMRRHGYWFVLYKAPPAHGHITCKRRDLLATTSARMLANRELSKEELADLVQYMPGLEVIINHEHNRQTVGVITDAIQDKEDGSVYVFMQAMLSESGRYAVELLEFNIMTGCSLAHARLGDIVQLQEISICPVGLREGTWLWGIAETESPLPRHMVPRLFQAPVFQMSRSITNATNVPIARDQTTPMVTLSPSLSIDKTVIYTPSCSSYTHTDKHIQGICRVMIPIYQKYRQNR